MAQTAGNARTLADKRVAILVTDGFEQVEMTEPRKALDQAGAKTEIVSPAEGQVKGWKDKQWGDAFPVDVPLSRADPQQYDALLLPGGVMNPDKLRMDPRAVQFVRAFVDAGKPIAAICHGPWTLVEAGAIQGRTLTSWPSLKTDIQNAGGKWEDREVMTDNGIVTSRKPDDIPAFNRKMIEEFAEGAHGLGRTTAGSGDRPEHESRDHNETAPVAAEIPESKKVVPIEEMSKSAGGI
jgi:protease I